MTSPDSPVSRSPDASFLLAEGLEEWACLLDRSGRIQWSSSKCIDLLGASPSQLGNLLWIDALGLTTTAPVDVRGQTLREGARRAIEQGLPWAMEAAPLPSDRPSWIDSGESLCQGSGPGRCWKLRIVPAGEGQLWALAQDLTNTLRLQAALEERSKVFDVVRRFGRVGVWQREIPSGRGHWDETMFRLFGFDPGQGTPDFEEAAHRVHPEDASVAAYQKSTLKVGDYQARYRVNLPDGSQRIIRSQWSVLPGPNGHPKHTIGVMSDETELEGLSRSFGVMTEQLRLAVEMAGVGLWVHDLATDRLHLSDELYRMMARPARAAGFSLAEVREFIHPDDIPLVQASALQALESNQPVDYEARYLRGDGSWHHVLSRRVVQRDESGRPVSFLGVSMNVTEQVAQRLRNQDLAARLDQIVATAGVGTWRRDLVTDKAEWNLQLYRIYGLDPKNGPPTFSQWVASLHPDDRPTALDAMRRVRDQPGVSVESSFRIHWPNGEIRWLEQRATFSNTPSGSALLTGITLDVTQRMRTEAALRSASDRIALAARSAGVGTWSVDHASGEAYWDEQMWRLRGLEPDGSTPDHARRVSLVHPDDRHFFRDGPDSVGRQIPEGGTFEFRVVWPDGQVRWLASRSRSVVDAHGLPISRVGVNWDVTDRRAAEQVREEREAALRASRAKSEFLARMSHELRTPLNAMLGFTQLLRFELADAPPSQRMKLDHIHSAGEHLLALINDVLELTRVEAGSLSLEIHPIDLDVAIEQVLPLVEALAEGHEVRIDAPSSGLQVLADPMRLRQVLINVLSNAIKYNRRAGRVWITTEADGSAGRVHIRIRDEGTGIAPAQVPHLFEPFNRLGVQSQDVEGTGIGLVIVKALCEAMNGEVRVALPAEGGTEVMITLPLPPPADQTAGSSASGHGLGAETGAKLTSTGQGTVLYIEDNPVNVLLVQELIETQTSLKLQVASTGSEGIRRAQAEPPDLILVDMQLPDMNGHEVLKRLRQMPATAHLPCVALSANAMREDIDRALAAGFEDYWTKPIDFASFLGGLRERFPPT